MQTNGPKGIGGWLILPVLGLVLSVIGLPILIGFEFVGYHGLADAIGAELPGYMGGVWFRVISDVVLILFAAWLLVLLFQRKRSLPRLYQIFLIVSALSIFADSISQYIWLQTEAPMYLQAGSIDQLSSDVFRSLPPQIVGTLLWVAYFNRSKRVKNTFVN